MTSSSDPRLERGLDAVLIVYSLLADHPASSVCEEFVRNSTGWFTTTLTLLEAKAILTKVYGVDPAAVSQKLAQFATGPVAVLDVDVAMTLGAMKKADTLRIDLTDAVLLQTCQTHNATRLATDDTKLAQACQQVGIIHENPIDDKLRLQMATWEASNVRTKGLPRLLWQIHQWLKREHPEAAEHFWSSTGGSSHLP